MIVEQSIQGHFQALSMKPIRFLDKTYNRKLDIQVPQRYELKHYTAMNAGKIIVLL